MALTRPPTWDEVENDERFKSLTPDLKLKTLDNWSNATRQYGIESGSFLSRDEVEKFYGVLNQKKQEYTSLIPKEVGTLEGIVNAASNAWDSSRQALAVTGGVTPDEAKEISKLEYNKQARDLAPGYKAYQEAEGWDAVKAFAANPIEVTTNIVAEGLAGSVPALAAGTTAGLAGAAALAPTGLGAAAGFTAGQIGGTFAGSLATEYGSKVLEELQKAGMDMKNPDSIVQFFSNQKLVDDAQTKAIARGVPVALFDAVTAGIGGRVGSIVKAAAKAPEKALIRKAAESAAVQTLTKTPTRLAATELGIQAAGGGLGEIAGAVAAGEPIQPKAVFAEVIGEVGGTGPLEIAQGMVATRKAEAKVAEDKKISETLKVEQTLKENNAPLTAQAVRDATVQSMTESTDQERLRALTLEPTEEEKAAAEAAYKEQKPPTVVAPAATVTVADEYKPEALQKLTDEELVAKGKELGALIVEAQKISAQPDAVLQLALENARAEYRRRQQAAKAAAPAPAPVAGTPAGTVSFVQGQEGRGVAASAAAPVVAPTTAAAAASAAAPVVAAAPAPVVAAAPAPSPALARTPEQIEQAREATFGLPKQDTFRKFVEDKMGLNSAVGVLKLLADNNVIPQGTQSLAQVQNPEQAMGWLAENKFDQMGRQTLPMFLMEKRQRGEALTPFTPAAGMPLFQAAEGAAPAPAAPAATPTPAAPAPTGLQALTEDELDQEETIQQQKSETATDEVQLAEANQALQQINAERTRRAQPPAPSVAETGAAPAVTEPAAATTDEAFNKAQQRLARLEELKAEREQIRSQMRGKLGQASMGADPELAFLAVKLAVNYAKEGIVRFSDWSARVQQDFPDMWDGIKDYLQEAWNTARSQVPELRPLEESGYASNLQNLTDEELTSEENKLDEALASENDMQKFREIRAKRGEVIYEKTRRLNKVAAPITRPVTQIERTAVLPLSAPPIGERPQVTITPAVSTPRLEQIPVEDSTGRSILSSSILHTVRNNEDVQKILSRGLKPNTNVTLDGGKPNQSIGSGITLVYAPGTVEAEPKGYNPNDGLVTKRSYAKPKAIFIESEEIDLLTRKTYSDKEIRENLDRLHLEMEAAAKEAKDNPSVVRNFYGYTPKESAIQNQLDTWYSRFDSLLKAQEQNPELTQEKGVSEEEALQTLLGNLPKDVPIYVYDANDEGEVSNLRLVSEIAAPTKPTTVSTTTTEPTLPLAPAPEGERPQVQITPPQRTEGVMPGGLIEYRQNLVKEARDSGVRTIRRSFDEIEADMKGKGWNGRKSLKNFVREVMDQANKDLQQGVAAPTQVIPDSKEEASLYEQARKTQAVPSMGTVIKRLYNYIGRTKKQLKEARTQIRPDKETSGLIVTLKSIQRNAQTQLANDLGITNPETIEFTSDLDGELRIPNRISTTVTSPGSLTNAADLVIESPDPNATQEEIEDTIYSNRTKIRAYLATLPNGSYEIKDVDGNVVGTLTIARPEVVAQTPAEQQAAKNLPQLRNLLQQKSDVISQIRVVSNRINKGDAGQPIPAGEFRRELENQLASLNEKSDKIEIRINKILDKTRQQVMKFAETATSPNPDPVLLATPPAIEGELSDYATFTDADGNEGLLFDAIEYLSGTLDVTFEDVFVNDSEITARQLDQGRKLVVPEDMRQRVAPGITFDPNTGEVTSAVSAINGGTRVTAPGQLMDAAIEAQTVMDTNFKPLREELIEIADVIDGIVRNEEGEVVSRQKPLTAEQVKLIEAADQFFQTWQVGANVDEARVAQIARILYAESFRKGGRNVTPRRAFSQAIQKLLDRQRYRPQVVSLNAPFKDGFKVYGDKPSISTMLEDFEGAMPADEAVEEPSLGVVEKPKRTAKGKGGDNFRNMLDYDELVYRQTTLRHARLIAADPELNRGSEAYLKQHAREMLTLRRKLAKDGKLKGFSQDEISNFTMSVLRDLDKNPLASTAAFEKGASKNHYSADPETAVTSDSPATPEESGRALRIIKEVISKHYPGIREVIITNGRGRMHVNDALSRTLFVNPQRVAEAIRNFDDDQAAAFIRASGMHEYFHLGLLRKMGVKQLKEIGSSLNKDQKELAADLYFNQVVFASEADRQAARDEFLSEDRQVNLAMEYLTMLAERMKRGESIQEMVELRGVQKSLMSRILAGIKTIWRRFEAHVMTLRNPALREQLKNLREGVRELDSLAYGESVYPESDLELREAPPEYADLVGNIFESYKGGKELKQFIVKLPGRGGKKSGTRATDAATAVRNVISRLIDQDGFVVINDRRFTEIKYAIAEALPKNDENAARRIAKVEVPKAERTLAQVSDAGKLSEDGKLVQGTFNFYSYSPDTRIREGMLGGPEKGGLWSNLKAMFTGRYSETALKTGGLGSSGKFTPQQRDIQLRKKFKIAADLTKAEFLVKKYKRVLGKLYKKDSDIPTDILNTALGSTENKYTDDQFRQLQAAANEQDRAALVRQFMEENIKTAKARIADAQSKLPGELVSVIREMRDTIDNLSTKLLEGNYLTSKMKLVVEANRNVYLHRSYQIFDNPEWKKLFEKPEPGSEHERILNAADRLFRMKAQADIARDLRMKKKENGIDMNIDDSLKAAAAYKDDIALKAHNMLIDYLSVADDKENNFLLTGALPGQRKLDIIKERGQIPKEIRELWGQIEDNETNFVKSVGKMSAFMAATDTGRELLDAGIKGGYIWKQGISEGNVPPAGFRPIYPPGTINDKNPLKEAYAPKDVRDAFRSLQDVNTVEGWAKWFSGLTAWTMAMKTVGNFPQGYVRNFLGNPLLIINGGFISGKDLVNPLQMMKNAKLAMRTALASTGLKFDEGVQALREEYVRNGVIGDNVESGLFKEMIQASMDQPGINSLWKDTKAQQKFKSLAKASTGITKTVFDKAANIYQGIDDFWKVFAYEQEKKFQRNAHSDWSETQIQQEAANRVRNKLPTYSMSPELTRSIRRTPFIAPFITWTSEVLRTGANTIGMAAEDIRVGMETNNPNLIANGRRALIGTLFSAALLPVAAATAKAIFGYDDDDDEAMRQFVPEYEKNDQLIYIGQREGGKVTYLNLSYLDPQQARAETAIAFFRALRGGRGVGEAFLDAATQMLDPLVSEQLFVGAIMDLARNRTAQGGPIWNEQDTPLNITATKLGYLASMLAPGVISGAGRRVYKAATGQVSKQAKSYDLYNELSGIFAGQRMGEVDAQTSLANKTRAFLANQSEAKQLLTGVLNSRGSVDLNDIPTAYDNAVAAHDRLYDDMIKAYSAAIRLGVPKPAAVRILRETLSDVDAASIAAGRIPRFRVSPITLETTLRNAPSIEEGRARRSIFLQTVQERNQQNK